MDKSNECPNCEKLQKELDDLKERMARLEEELRSSKRQVTPFSRSKKKSPSEGSKGKPGRKKGKGNFSYRTPPSADEINNFYEVPLKCCPDCGGEVTDFRKHNSFQEDIEIQKVTTQFVIHSGYCGNCKKRVYWFSRKWRKTILS